MTRQCELTGKLPMAGNRRSHALNSTRRVFRPNLCDVTLMSDVLGRSFRLRVSAHGLKTVEHRGGLDGFMMKQKADKLSDRARKIKRDITKAKAAQGDASQGDAPAA